MNLSKKIFDEHLFHLILSSKSFSKNERDYGETKKYLDYFLNHKLGYDLDSSDLDKFLFRLNNENIVAINNQKVIWKSNKNIDQIMDKLKEEKNGV